MPLRTDQKKSAEWRSLCHANVEFQHMIHNVAKQWQNIPLRKDCQFDTYFHTLSHDLRTPLTHICGFAELLKLDTNLAAPQRDYATAIVSACSELQNTVLAHLRLIESSLGNIALESQEGDEAPVDY